MDINDAIKISVGYLRAGDLHNSADILKKVLKIQPDNIYALHFLGLVHYQREEYKSAIEYITKTIQLAPTYAEPYNNLGIIFKTLRQKDEAIRYLHKALQINPNLDTAHTCLGHIYHETGLLDEATYHYQETLQLNSSDTEIFKSLGIVYAKLKKYDLAAQLFKRTLQINPTDAYIYLALALVIKEQGLLDEAIPYFRKAIELNPSDASAYKFLGIALRDKGYLDEAEIYKNIYQKALQKMKAFFIAGNKRSGSSFLVKLLNLHSQLYVSHESDIIWILYKFHNDEPLIPYPYDEPQGMEWTLYKCGHFLNKNNSPQENYFTIQQCLMREGFQSLLAPMSKTDLVWIGDKKPFQYADPSLVEFIFNIFPNPRFIHLVRHPFAVARSAKLFRGDGGYIWGNMSLEEIVELWTKYEKRVLNLKDKQPACVLDVRYEDLCKGTRNEIMRIFNFLNLEFDESLLNNISSLTKYQTKLIHKIACSEETLSIMAQYSYQSTDHLNP